MRQPNYILHFIAPASLHWKARCINKWRTKRVAHLFTFSSQRVVAPRQNDQRDGRVLLKSHLLASARVAEQQQKQYSNASTGDVKIYSTMKLNANNIIATHNTTTPFHGDVFWYGIVRPTYVLRRLIIV